MNRQRSAESFDQTGPDMPVLKVLLDGIESNRLSLGSPLVIGRGDDCDLCLPERQMSRRHCRIEPRDGGWELVDLGSTNGTFLAGRRITRHRLADGDTFTIGGASLQFGAETRTACTPEVATMRKAESPRDGIRSSVAANPVAQPSRSSPALAKDAGPRRPTSLWEAAVSSAAKDQVDHARRPAAKVSGGDVQKPWYRRPVPLPVGVGVALLIGGGLYILVNHDAAPPANARQVIHRHHSPLND